MVRNQNSIHAEPQNVPFQGSNAGTQPDITNKVFQHCILRFWFDSETAKILGVEFLQWRNSDRAKIPGPEFLYWWNSNYRETMRTIISIGSLAGLRSEIYWKWKWGTSEQPLLHTDSNLISQCHEVQSYMVQVVKWFDPDSNLAKKYDHVHAQKIVQAYGVCCEMV